jgi:hypothetical protein
MKTTLLVLIVATLAAAPAAAQPGKIEHSGLIRNRGSEKCLDVGRGSILQWACHGRSNQQFEIVALGRGEFAIRTADSGQVLDVARSSRDSGAAVVPFPWNGGANQRWRGEGTRDNFVLVNVNSGKCLDVRDGSPSDGAVVIQWDCHGGANQRWHLGYSPEPLPAPVPGGGAAARPPGTVAYTGAIMNRNSKRCLDVARESTAPRANVMQHSCHAGENQRFELVSLGRDEYAVVNRHSGLVLDVDNASQSNGANVMQYPWGGGANQRWRLDGLSGNFRLVNVHSGLCLDVQDRSMADGANIQQWKCHSAENQRWRLIE